MPGSFAGAQTDKSECESDCKPSQGPSKTRKEKKSKRAREREM